MSNKTLIDYKDLNQNFKSINDLTQVSESEVRVPSDLARDQMSLSFAGCGFLSFYYLGVTACLKQYSQINEKTIICGASSGTVPGLALCLNLSLEESTATLLELAIKVRAKPLGIAQPSCDMHKMIYDGLMSILPDDCHKQVSGRLYVSATRVSDGTNVLISQFDSKEDLIQAIQCSSFMPFLSGISPPKYKGIAYIDGALSNNAPKITENTITVSPWTGEFDICPLNDSSLPLQVMFYNKLISLSPLNIQRFTHIAIPPSWHMKTMMCRQGFNDTLRYLLRNNKILCTRCVAIQPPITSNEDSEEEKQSSDSGYENNCSKGERKSRNPHIHCKDCQHKQEEAVNDSLPEAVVQAIERGFQKTNQKLINRLSQYLAIKILIFLIIPFLFLIELIIAIILGIFLNDWSSQVFKDILNISKIMVTNGLTGRDHKSTFL